MRLTFSLLAFPLLAAGAQSEWTVATKPLLDLPSAGASGALNFESLAGATRLSNGSVLLADRGTTTIKLYDATGKLLKTGGGRGDGPGEFRVIMAAVGCGRDSLLAYDPSKGAAMVGSSLAIARQFKIPSDSSTVRRPLTIIACNDRGIAYVSDPNGRLAPDPAMPTVFTMLSSLVLVDRDGHYVSRVDSIRSMEMALTVSPTGGRGAFPRPLGLMPFVGFSEGNTVLGLSDSAQVITFDGNRARKVVPLSIARRAPTKDEFDESVSTLSNMNPQMHQAVADQLSKIPMPTIAPAYTAMLTDPSGIIWVETMPKPGHPLLLALRPDGKLAARITLPMPLTIMEIGDDYIMGTRNDDNDEPHLVVLKLTRR